MKSWSIRAWLALLIALSILPLVVLATIFVGRNALDEQGYTLDRVQQTTRAMTAAIDGHFNSRMALLTGLASSTALADDDLPQFRRRAEGALHSLPPGTEIVLFDLDAQQLVNTAVPLGAALPGITNLSLVKEVVDSRQPAVSDVFWDALGNRLTVLVSVPVIVEGRVRYVLGIKMFREEFNHLVSEQRIPPGWFIGLIDRNGILAARLPQPERFVGTLASPLLRQAINNAIEGHVETPTLEGVTVVSTWTRSEYTGWSMALAVPTDTLYAPLHRNLVLLLVSGLAAALIGGVLAHILGSSITSRLVRLERRARALATAQALPDLPRGIREIDNVDQELRSAADTIRDQQRHQQMLLAELDHRVKNILATVQALVTRSLGRSERTESIAGRIRALAEAHGLLTRMQGRGAALSEVIDTTLRVHIEGRQVFPHGPQIMLNAKATQAMALALHELATNAVKHGALSSATGRVDIAWSALGGSQPRFRMIWSESGGPTVRQPRQRGFGSTLIEKNLPSTLGGAVVQDYRHEGLVCRIEAPLDAVVSDSSPPVALSRETAQPRTFPPGRHILLVEDEPLLSDEMSEVLSEAGCRVSAASRIPEALELVRRESFDAAILDVNIHEGRSFPIAEALEAARVKFIFLTGYEDPGIWPEKFRGHTRLTKPVEPSALYSALAALFVEDAVPRDGAECEFEALDTAPIVEGNRCNTRLAPASDA